MKLKNIGNAILFVVAISMGNTVSISAQEKTVVVGGAVMYPSKNIIENASNSKDHTILVSAVKAAGLVETLSGKGPFTVFAPTNRAFKMLPAATLDNLMKPENKEALIGVLTYHVVPGKIDSKSIMKAIKAGKGKATMKTVQGEDLTFMMDNKGVWVVDAKGNKAMIITKDVYQSNGVIHVIDHVMMP